MTVSFQYATIVVDMINTLFIIYYEKSFRQTAQTQIDLTVNTFKHQLKTLIFAQAFLTFFYFSDFISSCKLLGAAVVFRALTSP